MSSENRYQIGNDEYATPDWIKKGLFNGWFDPCPLYEYSNGTKIDGLKTDWWTNRIFINPPYSNPMPWVDRAILENKKGKTIALLLKHDTSTLWWAKLHEAGAHFLPIMGRLQFVTQKGRREGRKAAAPFPSVLVILYPSISVAKK